MPRLKKDLWPGVGKATASDRAPAHLTGQDTPKTKHTRNFYAREWLGFDEAVTTATVYKKRFQRGCLSGCALSSNIAHHVLIDCHFHDIIRSIIN